MKTTMKLGAETGSVMNHLMSGGQTSPEVGKGATQLHWTDRTAYFVNSVSADKKKCTIERAKAIRVDNNGMSEAQNYRYGREENAAQYNLVFRYGSWWIDNGKEAHVRFSKIKIKFGFMQAYYDYSF